MKQRILSLFALVLFTVPNFVYAQNNALNFDGANDYVTVADNASLDLSSAMTIEFWINLGSNTGAEIISKSNGDGDENFRIFADQSIRFILIMEMGMNIQVQLLFH